jgi:hypothetical protein
MCARGGELRRLAGAGERQAGDDARQIPVAEPGAVQALRGGFADRGKAAPQAKAEIRRPRGSFAEDFARERAKAGAAVCAAAIDAEQEDIRAHEPDILSGMVSKGRSFRTKSDSLRSRAEEIRCSSMGSASSRS